MRTNTVLHRNKVELSNALERLWTLFERYSVSGTSEQVYEWVEFQHRYWLEVTVKCILMAKLRWRWHQHTSETTMTLGLNAITKVIEIYLQFYEAHLITYWLHWWIELRHCVNIVCFVVECWNRMRCIGAQCTHRIISVRFGTLRSALHRIEFNPGISGSEQRFIRLNPHHSRSHSGVIEHFFNIKMLGSERCHHHCSVVPIKACLYNVLSV